MLTSYRMEEDTYKEIYRRLEEHSLGFLSRKFCIEKEILQSILNLKLVRRNKELHRRIRRETGELLQRWEDGESLLEISSSLGFSPILTSSFVMLERGFTKGEFRMMLRKPGEIKDRRLRKEIEAVVEKDFLYSPWAHALQRKRGRMGEEILKDWLKSRGADLVMQKKYKKTPDFLLKEPLHLKGLDVYWADSKAIFCDEEEHKRYLKKQFCDYLQSFGPGLVVYWYGFMDSVPPLEPRIIVKDRMFFDDPRVGELLKLTR